MSLARFVRPVSRRVGLPLVLLGTVLVSASFLRDQATRAEPAGPAAAAPEVAPLADLTLASQAAPLAKVAPGLRAVAKSPVPGRTEWLVVTADRALDLAAFGPT